nr:glycosyltransferase [Microbacterium arborescens]
MVAFRQSRRGLHAGSGCEPRRDCARPSVSATLPGSRPPREGARFEGRLDEGQIPYGERTVTEVRAIYLSGAPRLSTSPESESLGPRSHILGVIDALTQEDVTVEQFIVGDRSPRSFSAQGSEKRISKGLASVVATDVLRLVYRVKSRLELRRKVKGERFELAYERYALFQELGSILRGRARWVLEVNALLAIEATTERRATTSRRLASAFERRTLQRADHIVAVTQALADQIVDTYDVDPTRIIVIQNGVRPSPPEEWVPSRERPTTVGFLGALYEWQNVDLLLRALSSQSLQHLKLEIAGEGPELENLRKTSSRLGLDSRVSFLGRVHPDDVPMFLQGVDLCFAGHSSANGTYFSPLKLWEYLGAGRVVVASAHDATNALATDGFGVVTYASDTAVGVQAGFEEALQGYAELRARAERGLEKVAGEYSWRARIAPLMRIVAGGKT